MKRQAYATLMTVLLYISGCLQSQNESRLLHVPPQVDLKRGRDTVSMLFSSSSCSSCRVELVVRWGTECCDPHCWGFGQVGGIHGDLTPGGGEDHMHHVLSGPAPSGGRHVSVCASD